MQISTIFSNASLATFNPFTNFGMAIVTIPLVTLLIASVTVTDIFGMDVPTFACEFTKSVCQPVGLQQFSNLYIA